VARRVGLFLLLTYVWSWSLLGAAWVAEGPAVLVLRLLAGLGPALAAALLLHRTVTVSAQRAFWRRVVDARSVGPRWWLLVTVASAGPAVVVAGLGLAGIEGDRALGGLERPGAVGLLGIVAFALAAGLAEEPGWRGYLLDGLRAGGDATSDRHGGLSDPDGPPARPDAPGRRALLSASMVIAVGWAAWHLPLYAIPETFQHEVGLGTPLYWVMTGALLPQTVLMVWVLERTSWSILPAVVFHALVNVSGELVWSSLGGEVLRLLLWTVPAIVVAVAWVRRPTAAVSASAA
jgi:uncharacterized protein